MKIYLSPSSQTDTAAEYTQFSSEKEAMRSLADKVKPLLENKGHTVYLASSDKSLSARIKESNEKGVDRHVALHSNGADGSATGMECYYYSGSTTGKSCAESILSKMSNITGAPKNRGAKSDKLVETSDTKATAVLLEVAFHDNTSDVKWMEAHWDDIAKAIADGY